MPMGAHLPADSPKPPTCFLFSLERGVLRGDASTTACPTKLAARFQLVDTL